MQSTSFRLVWTLATVVLFGALVWVIRLAWLSNPATLTLPTARQTLQVTPTPTPQPTLAQISTATAVPMEIALGGLQSIRSGGFAFRPLIGYALEVSEATVIMQPELNSARTDGLFQLSGGPPEQFTPLTTGGLQAQLRQFAAEYAQANDLQVGEPFTITVGSVAGYAVDLKSKPSTQARAGRMVMAQPGDRQLFAMIGVASAARWANAASKQFAAVLTSVSFFTPAALADLRPPARTPTPAPQLAVASRVAPSAVPTPRARASTAEPWQSFTNANRANGITASINTIWVSTDGGVVAWNKSNNTSVKYTTLEGLAANRTTTVVNCPLRGFGIVFGSEVGLQIFESQSNQWKLLNSTNSSMSFDDVSALYCDLENRYLLIGYQQHGLDIFDADSGAWRYVGQRQGLQNNFVEAVAVVGDREQIWVASGFGVSVINATGEFAFYDESNSALETNQIWRIAVDDAGVVWLGAQNALYKIDGEHWTIYDQREVLASQFPSGELRGLAVANDGTLWIGSNQGEICHFDPVRVQCRAFFAGDAGMVAGELTSLTIGSNGAIYYTTDGGGVSMFDGEAWRAFIVPDQPLLGNSVHALAQGGDGAIWIASEAGLQRTDAATGAMLSQFTQDNADLSSLETEVLHPAAEGGMWFGALGASYFNGFSWKNYTMADGLAGSLIRAIATDSQGRTWFGTESGLSIWNGSTFFNLTRENGLPSDNISALLASGDVMWIGAMGGGLFRFEKNQLQLFNTQNSNLPSDTITTIAQDRTGALLVGHIGGLAYFDEGDATPIEELDGYAVTAIATTPDDAIWVGTSGDGLFYFDGEQWTRPPGDVQPPSPSISAILVDEQGSVWIGARAGGLIRYVP